MKPKQKITYEVSQGLHKASLGSSSVAVESRAKKIPKETKEFLAEKLQGVVEFRCDPARKKTSKGDWG